jgi:hypothetical protein
VKSRLVLIFIALLAFATLSIPVMTASAAPRPTQLSPHTTDAHRSAAPKDVEPVDTFCLNTDDTQCLNLEQCKESLPAQTWDISSGGACSDWSVEFEGTVGTGGSEAFGNVFTCGNDWNATYYGDVVYLVQFYPQGSDGNGLPVPASAGYTDPVYLRSGGDYAGYWVATGDSTDTELIDPYSSCHAGALQYVYAGCKGNGCLVRESPNPPSLLFWQWIGYDVNV